MIIYRAYHDEYREYGSGERHFGYYSTKEKALKAIEKDMKEKNIHNPEIIIYQQKGYEHSCWTLDGKPTSYTYNGYVIELIEVE